ncbi:MAG: DegV family protein [Bariatricus sp.]
MSYKIIVDSCGELTEEMKASGIFETASLTMDVDDYHFIDDETFDQADFLKKVAESPNCPKSSCPSPERYMQGYNCDADRVYVVTLSAELSGSYNSAVLGVNLYHEEYGEKDIYVFNSRSASIGETLIACKIMECEEGQMTFPEVIDAVEAYIGEQNTFFVLESLETLRKNGRLTGLKAIAANVLNIKPVMGSTPKGEICQLGQARGMKKALQKMVDCIAEKTVHAENRVLAISHCNCPERAEILKKMIEESVHPKQILVLDTRGISSMYANDGGVIVAV